MSGWSLKSCPNRAETSLDDDDDEDDDEEEEEGGKTHEGENNNNRRRHDFHANIPPSTGHENNIAQPKVDKCLGSPSHFSSFFTV